MAHFLAWVMVLMAAYVAPTYLGATLATWLIEFFLFGMACCTKLRRERRLHK